MKSLIVALWAKLYPWKKKPKYQIDEDFHFLSSEEDDVITNIGILKGKYAGVVYQYGKAKIVEEGDFARLSFDYTIINSSSFDMNDLQNDEEFVTMIGDILTEILLEKPNEKTRNYDTEELNLQ
jgi:hypothetical protein